MIHNPLVTRAANISRSKLLKSRCVSNAVCQKCCECLLKVCKESRKCYNFSSSCTSPWRVSFSWLSSVEGRVTVKFVTYRFYLPNQMALYLAIEKDSKWFNSHCRMNRFHTLLELKKVNNEQWSQVQVQGYRYLTETACLRGASCSRVSNRKGEQEFVR